MIVPTAKLVELRIVEEAPQAAQLAELLARVGNGAVGPNWLPGWPNALREGLGHEPILLSALEGERLVGYLPLALVRGRLFGRFLVSLPYINSAGVVAIDDHVAGLLVDRAVQSADKLDVRYLELRQERRIEHPALTREVSNKVHMRLDLPATSDELWDQLKAKVRNQVRKGREPGFDVRWVGAEALDDFYHVFSRNMRDLGTPVFGRGLFRAIIERLAGQAELCVVRDGTRPIASALVVHGQGVSEVPSASSLKRYNSANANMLMYWHLLVRAIERGQRVFDFGRSTVEGSTYRFKKQWGAQPQTAIWQYYVRSGDVGDVRPDHARFQLAQNVWRRLPVWLTRVIGPPIVRGIP
jgi:FemAB-related protein (PEP-CTERM system-associated)